MEERFRFRRRHLLSVALFCSGIIWFDGNILSYFSPSSQFRNRHLLSEESEGFNKINPHPDWCPYAKCSNTVACEPCKKRFLIIIASGRSGSTTLNQMINLLPKIRMAGENNNELYVASNLIQNLRRPSVPFALRDQSGPWMHNMVPDGTLSCPIQDFFAAINPPKRWYFMDRERFYEEQDFKIIGFKTIRFHLYQPEWSIEKSVQFVREHFPCSRILVNVRSDTASQALSQKKSFNIEGPMSKWEEELKTENRRLERIAKEFGEQAYFLDMSEWSKPDGGVEVINKAVEWLGYKNCTFSSIRHDNGGKNGYGSDLSTEIDLGPNCRYGDEIDESLTAEE